MALMKSKEIPKDAVILNEMEAATYAWDMVGNWGSFADTWALKYGPAVLGGINALSGILINKHYRHKLKLGTYGYLSSVIPISVMPGLMTALFHRHLISTDLLLLKHDSCPICFELRSGAIQCGLGIIYPMCLAPISSLMFANRYSTCRVPNIAQPKLLYQFLRKISTPLSGTLVFLGVFQFVASSLITYFEIKNNFTLRKKIMDIENEHLRKANEQE